MLTCGSLAAEQPAQATARRFSRRAAWLPTGIGVIAALIVLIILPIGIALSVGVAVLLLTIGHRRLPVLVIGLLLPVLVISLWRLSVWILCVAIWIVALLPRVRIIPRLIVASLIVARLAVLVLALRLRVGVRVPVLRRALLLVRPILWHPPAILPGATGCGWRGHAAIHRWLVAQPRWHLLP